MSCCIWVRTKRVSCSHVKRREIFRLAAEHPPSVDFLLPFVTFILGVHIFLLWHFLFTFFELLSKFQLLAHLSENFLILLYTFTHLSFFLFVSNSHTPTSRSSPEIRQTGLHAPYSSLTSSPCNYLQASLPYLRNTAAVAWKGAGDNGCGYY